MIAMRPPRVGERGIKMAPSAGLPPVPSGARALFTMRCRPARHEADHAAQFGLVTALLQLPLRAGRAAIRGLGLVGLVPGVFGGAPLLHHFPRVDPLRPAVELVEVVANL